MTRENALIQLLAKLTNEKINFSQDTQREKIILNPIDKPESMSIPTWQFQLKLVAYFNQQGICICGNSLTNFRDLHHAVISRNDVKGCRQEIKNLIHHTYNVIEICKDCHLLATREKSARFLAKLYGEENIVNWYNEFPLKIKIYRIEAFLDSDLTFYT